MIDDEISYFFTLNIKAICFKQVQKGNISYKDLAICLMYSALFGFRMLQI